MDCTIVARILRIGNLLEEGKYDLASKEMINLQKDACITGNADERIAHVFHAALKARLAKATQSFPITSNSKFDAGNLYENPNQDGDDMVTAFTAFSENIPLVKVGHVFSNLAILKATMDYKPKSVHILDLGIGTGQQWFSFLEMLASSKTKLTITGVDLPCSIENPYARLQAIGDALNLKAAEIGIDFSFRYFAGHLETLDLLAVGHLLQEPPSMLAVNASLTLHHIPDQRVNQTNPLGHVLDQIRSLSPAVFTLTEPSSDHNEDHFPTRLRECVRDFSALFRALARLLQQHPRERLVVERDFLGREVMNILACEGADRVERHAPHAIWATRLYDAGFQSITGGPDAEDLVREVPSLSDPDARGGWTMEAVEGGMHLLWEGEPILAVSAWTTCDQAP